MTKIEDHTDFQILTHILENGPKNRFELRRELRKPYTTVYDTVKILFNDKFLCTSRKKKVKNVEYCDLTLYGLIVLIRAYPKIWEKIDSIAQIHSDRLLIFNKWDFFVKNGLREEIIKRLKLTIESCNEWDLYVFAEVEQRKYAINPFYSPEIIQLSKKLETTFSEAIRNQTFKERDPELYKQMIKIQSEGFDAYTYKERAEEFSETFNEFLYELNDPRPLMIKQFLFGFDPEKLSFEYSKSLLYSEKDTKY
ncbi:MAG: hypothetical protein ABSB40_12640, partial [Nitrososphaeria archaeon]